MNEDALKEYKALTYSITTGWNYDRVLPWWIYQIQTRNVPVFPFRILPPGAVTEVQTTTAVNIVSVPGQQPGSVVLRWEVHFQ